eukprot:scaffold3587_cov364-Prasinococcus_capsulatus_cf.AAC.4
MPARPRLWASQPGFVRGSAAGRGAAGQGCRRRRRRAAPRLPTRPSTPRHNNASCVLGCHAAGDDDGDVVRAAAAGVWRARPVPLALVSCHDCSLDCQYVRISIQNPPNGAPILAFDHDPPPPTKWVAAWVTCLTSLPSHVPGTDIIARSLPGRRSSYALVSGVPQPCRLATWALLLRLRLLPTEPRPSDLTLRM